MNDRGQVTFAFPRPGRALKVVLIVIAALGLFEALLATWIPGGEQLFLWLACDVEKVMHGQVWRLLTSGLLTSPESPMHLVFTLIGLYFFSPDLERRWGSWRFVRFLALAVIVGNLTAIAVGFIAPMHAARFHPALMFGASAATSAVALAWAQMNADAQAYLWFFPVRGKVFFWLTIGFCALNLIYPTGIPEGVAAPFGGILVALVLGGQPSLVRTLYLRAKLFLLRRKSNALRVEDVLRGTPPTRKPRASSPPLRIVQGGLEDVLRKRKPPKDKRYLN
jgi:membrane associated rhomboid family serine protease